MSSTAANDQAIGAHAAPGKPAGRRPGPGGSPLARFNRDEFDRDVWCVLGLPIDNITIDGLVAAVDRAVDERRRLSLVTPNVNWLVRASTDARSRNETIVADMSVADGAPVVAFARMLGAPIRARVAGSDLFEALRRRPRFARQPLRVFLFGGRDGAAEAAVKALNAEAGGVEAVGWINPGFGDVADMSDEETIAAINAADPDFVLVALGAAKGQAWINHNQHSLLAPVLAHLGAVIDFSGGGVKRAPKMVQKAGLEWAWRIKEEPALWRRYAHDLVALSELAMRALRAGVFSRQRRRRRDAKIDLRLTGGAVTLVFDGDFRATDRAKLREAFRRAASSDRDIVLDLTHAVSLDAACLGLLIILEKHVVQSGRSIYLSGAGRRISRILGANSLRFPELANGPAQTGEERMVADAT